MHARPEPQRRNELARLLGRPRADVRQRARALSLEWSRVGVGHRWSASEDALLRRAVDDGLRVSEIVPLLTRRSPGAVAARINALGLAVHGRRWTTADDYRLRLAIEAGDSIDRVAADLERTREAIRHRCRDLGLSQPRAARDGRAYQRWTSQEETRLIELRDLPPGEIARREWAAPRPSSGAACCASAPPSRARDASIRARSAASPTARTA